MRSNEVPPRLGVVHLLLWTACCAAFFSAARSFAQKPAGLVGAALLVAVAMGVGAAWLGLAITLGRLALGKRWPIEPGQWLLAIVGVMETASLMLLAAAGFGIRNRPAIVLAVSACAFVVPTLSRRIESRWKWFFAAAAIVYALPLLISVLAAQVDVPPFLVRASGTLSPRKLSVALAAAALLLALFEPERKDRGWLHWAGIGTAVWLAAVSLCAFLSESL